jgi:hypothetical protein
VEACVPIPNLFWLLCTEECTEALCTGKKPQAAPEDFFALSPSTKSQLSRYLACLESSDGSCVEQQILWGAKT